jgi:hypothetical protein
MSALSIGKIESAREEDRELLAERVEGSRATPAN